MKTITVNLRQVAGAGTLIGFVSLAAWADTPPPPPPPMSPPSTVTIMGACKQDFDTFCPTVKPGDGGIAACLKTNWKSVSAGCKEAIKERRREKQETPASGAPPPAPATGTPPAPLTPPAPPAPPRT